MVKGAVDSIESFGLVDGPGIRTVVFLSGCKLRCKYCHNPEMWVKGKENYTPEELAKRILRNRPYFNSGGGVTFSGGEPLLQGNFLIEVCKILKQENIHIVLDTAGVGNGNYDEILSYVDLILLDIKHIDEEKYRELTGQNMTEFYTFLEAINRNHKKVWVRQVIIPDINDNIDYIERLVSYIKKIDQVEKVEFLPYHKMGDEKYQKLKISNPFKEKAEMNIEKCQVLHQEFMRRFHDEKD